MEILFVTSELAPYGPSSALAEASAALPKALRGLGHRVTVLSPLYPHIDPTARSLARRLSTLSVQAMGKTHTCMLFDGRTTGGVDLVFVACPDVFVNGDLEQRALAAVVLGGAAAQFAAKREPAFEIVHAMGEGAALTHAFARVSTPQIARVLSLVEPVHAQPFSHALLDALMLPAEVRAAFPEALESALGAGIAAADIVVTNAASAARSLASGTGQDALAALLATKGSHLVGVVNGVDASIWNPVTDSSLSARFDAVNLQGKTRCKGTLQYQLGLAVNPDVPLILALGELSHARGSDRITEIAEYALRDELQLAVLHTGTEASVERGLAALAETGVERIALRTCEGDSTGLGAGPFPSLGADKLRHLALAGSDFMLIPAREPSGLELGLSALRYGTLPIARPVGVLGDTLVDTDAKLETGNAFIIDNDTREDTLATVQRALAAFHKGSAWDTLRRRVMRTDVSWERSARKYEHAYRQVRAQSAA